MADKMPGRAAQTASSIPGGDLSRPADPQARLSALCVIAGLSHATLGPNPSAPLSSLLDHLEAQRSPPAPSLPTF
jgi:hypothetical protein